MITRADIAFTIYATISYAGCKKGIRYILNSLYQEIILPSNPAAKQQPDGYCDRDLQAGSCPVTRILKTGYYIFLGEPPILKTRSVAHTTLAYPGGTLSTLISQILRTFFKTLAPKVSRGYRN